MAISSLFLLFSFFSPTIIKANREELLLDLILSNIWACDCFSRLRFSKWIIKLFRNYMDLTFASGYHKFSWLISLLLNGSEPDASHVEPSLLLIWRFHKYLLEQQNFCNILSLCRAFSPFVYKYLNFFPLNMILFHFNLF